MRSANIEEVRINLGSGTLTIPGDQLGGGTSITPDMPTQTMQDGSEESTGKRHSLTLELLESEKVSVFEAAYVAAPGTATDPTSTPADWTSLGRLENEGDASYDASAAVDGGQLPLFRNMTLAVTFEPVDHATAEAALSSYSEKKAAIALERVDGTYKIFQNVKVSTITNPGTGPESFQTLQVRLTAGSRDITKHSKNISSTYFSDLNAAQIAAEKPSIEVDTLADDGTTNTLTFDPVGFSATPLEPLFQESLEGAVVEGAAYGPTEGAYLTVA